MDLDLLKNFVNRDVEVLVAGVWIEGHMTPIVKGQVTLLPYGEAAAFYGPCALKAEVIQAVRQVKRENTQPTPVPQRRSQVPVRSSFDSHPGKKFVIG